MPIEIERSEENYTVRLPEGMVLKILVNDIEIFQETIRANKEGLIDFRITQQQPSS